MSKLRTPALAKCMWLRAPTPTPIQVEYKQNNKRKQEAKKSDNEKSGNIKVVRGDKKFWGEVRADNENEGFVFIFVYIFRIS